MLLFAILISAAILGIIIVAMDGGDFPGWGKMIVCVLAAVIPAAIINAALPDEVFIVGLLVGALCAGFAISATCGMSLKRSFIASGIYLACNLVISGVFYLVFK